MAMAMALFTCRPGFLYYSSPNAAALRNWGPPPGELNTDGRDMLIYGILSSDNWGSYYTASEQVIEFRQPHSRHM